MKLSIRKGFGFGLTSGVITTLGLLVGLSSGTHSKPVVLGGVLMIAVADGLSDSFGIHISEEAARKSEKSIWESSIATFIFKMCFSLTFIIPLLLLNLNAAVWTSIIWGAILITLFSYRIAKKNNTSVIKTVAEHLAIAILVVVITHYLGELVSNAFTG